MHADCKSLLWKKMAERAFSPCVAIARKVFWYLVWQKKTGDLYLPCKQEKVSSCSTYPGLHSHRKEPIVLTQMWWQMLPSYMRHSSISSTSTGLSTAFSPFCSWPMEKASLRYGLSDTTAQGESSCYSHKSWHIIKNKTCYYLQYLHGT